MDISTLQTGAFESLKFQMQKDQAQESAAPRIQMEPSMAQQLREQRAVWTSSVINKQPAGFVNLSGQQLGKVFNVKA